MKSIVIPIEVARKDFISIRGIDGNVYVMSLKAYRQIAQGKIDFKEVEGFEFIIPTIVQEWLDFVIDANEN